jgi:hypothetical protein
MLSADTIGQTSTWWVWGRCASPVQPHRVQCITPGTCATAISAVASVAASSAALGTDAMQRQAPILATALRRQATAAELGAPCASSACPSQRQRASQTSWWTPGQRCATWRRCCPWRTLHCSARPAHRWCPICCHRSPCPPCNQLGSERPARTSMHACPDRIEGVHVLRRDRNVLSVPKVREAQLREALSDYDAGHHWVGHLRSSGISALLATAHWAEGERTRNPVNASW